MPWRGGHSQASKTVYRTALRGPPRILAREVYLTIAMRIFDCLGVVTSHGDMRSRDGDPRSHDSTTAADVAKQMRPTRDVSNPEHAFGQTEEA